MNLRRVSKLCMALVLVALGTEFGWDQASAAQRGRTDVEEEVQVLTRGPVHEAFAETVTFDPEPGIVVPKAPPAAIEELPPEQKPEGANVTWIPGYWGWDDERSDFLWVSGVWRALPPGRQWVPGYWGNSGKAFQWTSGYWADANMSDVEYLPEPPETVEAGPNIAAPSADSSWLPGCWVWRQNRYAWRPVFGRRCSRIGTGFRTITCGPRAAMFSSMAIGIARSTDAACCFAPVQFNASVYSRPGFSYSPTTVIDLSAFTNHLFLRPRYQHYYFGDYYAASYQSAGFFPWFSFQSSHLGYDPIYAHQRWQYRQDPQWEHRMEADFRKRRDQQDVRPPHTWADQERRGSREDIAKNRRPVIATPFDQLIHSKDSRLRFQPLDTAERQRLGQRGQEVQKLREERRKLETDAVDRPKEKRSQEFAPVRVRFPGSPIVARSDAELGKDQAPPKVYKAPKPDPKVEPKPRGEPRGKSRGEARGNSGGEDRGKPRGKASGKSGGRSRGDSGGESKGKSGGKAKGKSKT